MRALTYVLVAGVFFWTGALHSEASRPLPPPKVVRPVAAFALTQWRCDDQERREYVHACFKRKQSDLIRQINPNTKGKL